MKPNVDEADVQYLIERYTERVLTHDEDILNAFDGILADLEQNEPPIKSHWGIFSIPDASGYFNGLLAGLCWVHSIQNEKICRRLGFPSWSWAGWSYMPCVDYVLRRTEDTKLVVAHGLAIQVEKQSGLIEAWKTFEEASLASTQRHHYSQRIHISAPSLEIRLFKYSAVQPHRGSALTARSRISSCHLTHINPKRPESAMPYTSSRPTEWKMATTVPLCTTYSHCSSYPKWGPTGSELVYGSNHSSQMKKPKSLTNGLKARRPTRRETFGLHKLYIGYSGETHQEVEHYRRDTSSQRGNDGTR
jgi:hypothetical protein